MGSKGQVFRRTERREAENIASGTISFISLIKPPIMKGKDRCDGGGKERSLEQRKIRESTGKHDEQNWFWPKKNKCFSI